MLYRIIRGRDKKIDLVSVIAYSDNEVAGSLFKGSRKIVNYIITHVYLT